MANQYEELAKDILKHVGGEENVRDIRHCITRLRFRLKDESKADTEYLKKRDGVVTVVQSGGQYQVVIGNHVPDVYESILSVSNIGGAGSVDIDEGDEGPKGNLFDRFVDLMSGLFQPFLGPLAASGMIKGLVAILGAMGYSADNSGLYSVLNATGDAFFQYLPIVLAISAAAKFKMNTYTAVGIAAALVYPTLTNMTALEPLYTLFQGTAFESVVTQTFLGIPILLPPGGYYTTVIPAILAVYLGSRLEKKFREILPAMVRSFLAPFFTLLVAVPISLLVLGPIATWASNLVGLAFTSLYTLSPIVFGILLGGLWQVLVMFGLHWGLIPVGIVELQTQGFSVIFAVISAVSFSQLGAILAVWFKTKETKVKALAIPAAISGLFGVTEPAIYGISLPMKTPFIMSLIGGAIQGAFIGLFDVRAVTLGGLGVFTIPSFIVPENGSNVVLYLVNIALATVAGFILTMLVKIPKLYDEEPVLATTSNQGTYETPVNLKNDSEKSKDFIQQEIMASPITGRVVKLSEISDPAFSSGALGKGLAIEPTHGEIVAPINGTVTTLFPTGHAIGITSENGSEILIHIGMDTVQLEGQGFKALVAQGDTVTAGQKLIEFDIAAIKEAGFPTVTPIVITNTNDFADVLLTGETSITSGDYFMTMVR